MPLRLHPDVSAITTDDGTILLHQRTGRYWQLNPTGADVLRHLLDGQPSEQIAADLAARYHITPQQAQHDVTSVIEHLRIADLVDNP